MMLSLAALLWASHPDSCVDRLTAAMGGAERWNRIRYVAFEFVVERDGKEIARHRHLWDRWSGRYRVEGKNRSGQSYRILFADVNTKSGSAIIDGTVCGQDSLKKFLEYGYARYINDTYWLLAPWKLRDPGVSLQVDGNCQLALSFDGVGLTPGDQYWLTLDHGSGLVTRWRYRLQDGTEGEFDWSQWVERGGVRFCEVKTSSDSRSVIRTEKVRVFSDLAEESFSLESSFPE